MNINIKAKRMHKSNGFNRQSKQSQPVKGMTLFDYFTSFTEMPRWQEEARDEKQENLFQSSGYERRKGLRSKNRPSRIEEIDQQSVQDSVEYNKASRTKATPNFKKHPLHINEASQQNLLPQKGTRAKMNSVSINVRQNFKGSSQQRNSFKVKKMSISPTKRASEEMLINGSMTLHGSKFGQATKREEAKMNELLTFYGKLNLDKQQSKIKQKTSLKADEMKQSFKKKNQLELKELLMLQSRIKSNYRLNTNNREMMVLGTKDKINERRQRYIE